MDNAIKKKNLIINVVLAVRQLLEAKDKLEQFALEFPSLTIGNDDTFTDEQIKHLTGYMVNYTLGNILSGINATLNANDNAFRDMLYKVK